jgi:multidrug resistance protein, MATE family
MNPLTPPSTTQLLGRHIAETMFLAGPVIIGQLGHIAINQADTVMVGGLGPTALGAATLANGLWIFPAVAGIGIFASVSALTAQWIGAQKSELALGKLLQQSVLLSFWIGLLICLVQLLMVELMGMLGQDPAVVALAKPYFRIVALSSIPMIIFLGFRNFIEGFEKTLPGMVIMFFMVFFNIGFNYLLINGKLGFPELGLNGAGYATLIARILGMLMIAAYVYWSPTFKRYWPIRRVLEHNWSVMKEVIKIGGPSGMQYTFEVGAFSGAVVLAGWLGEKSLSAHQIALGIASFAFMFYLGISIAASIRVGNAKGRNDLAEVRLAGLAAQICGGGFIVIFVSGMVLFREQLPWIYIKDPEVAAMTVPLLLIAAFFQVFDGIQGIGVGILRGMSDVRIPTAITFIAYWVIGFPAAYVLMQVFDLGLEGIWYGLTAGLAFSAVFVNLRFLRKSRYRG